VQLGTGDDASARGAAAAAADAPTERDDPHEDAGGARRLPAAAAAVGDDGGTWEPHRAAAAAAVAAGTPGAGRTAPVGSGGAGAQQPPDSGTDPRRVSGPPSPAASQRCPSRDAALALNTNELPGVWSEHPAKEVPASDDAGDESERERRPSCDDAECGCNSARRPPPAVARGARPAGGRAERVMRRGMPATALKSGTPSCGALSPGPPSAAWGDGGVGEPRPGVNRGV